MSESFKKLEHLSDVVLVSSDGVEFSGHKVILSNHSRIFQEMFSESSAKAKARLNFDNLDSNQLSDFLEYMYGTGDTEAGVLKESNLKILVELARKYDMPGLLAACDRFATRKVVLDPSSILDWLPFALEYELPDFSSICERVLKNEAARIIDEVVAHIKEGRAVNQQVVLKVLETAGDKLKSAGSSSGPHKRPKSKY